jgi:hypothetical protein
VRSGRVGQALLREAIPNPTEPLVYVCGPAISTWDLVRAKETGVAAPPRFLETVLADLTAIGVPPNRIKRESYG